MKLSSNYSVTRLFIDKTVTIVADTYSVQVAIPSLHDFYTDEVLNSMYHLWTSPIDKIQQLYITPIKSSFQALETMIFELGRYDRYRTIANNMRIVLSKLLPQAQIDMSAHQIKIGKMTMTSEI